MQELLKGIAEFCEIRREEGTEHVSLADFLSEVSLLTDQDNDKEEQANKVTMMTVHAAKGLEFRNVFVVGLEEDLFPSAMSKDNPRAVEEERRLFYVAITRAEENLCIDTRQKPLSQWPEYDVFAQSFLERYRSQIYLYVGRCRYYQRFIGYSSFLGFPATEGNGRRGLCLSGRSGSRTAGSSDTDGNGFFVFGPVFVFCAGSVGFACRG